MKKALIIALAGFIMIAFTQCGSSGSPEFKDTMNYLKKAEKAMKSAKTCEELDAATDLFWEGSGDKQYAKEDEMTEEETLKAFEYLEKVGKVYDELTEKFGCD
jgi:hypothetical protein